MTPKTQICAVGVLFFGVVAMPKPAESRCQCSCVNGQVVALCESTLDIEPICPPRVCPIVTPSVRPIDPPRVPPIGTKNCSSEQVYNSATGRYEWQEVCQ